MEMTIYNTIKSRLESIRIELTEANTTWFDEGSSDHQVYTITDLKGGLMISERGYSYPLWVDGVTRASIGYYKSKAARLRDFYLRP
jgi:hypothetical protein